MYESERRVWARKENEERMYLFCFTVEIILKYLHLHILRKNAGKTDDGEASS